MTKIFALAPVGLEQESPEEQLKKSWLQQALFENVLLIYFNDQIVGYSHRGEKIERSGEAAIVFDCELNKDIALMQGLPKTQEGWLIAEIAAIENSNGSFFTHKLMIMKEQ